MSELTAAQRAALDHVTARAAASRDKALARLAGSGVDAARAAAAIGQHARVTLNFHPDRLLVDGRTVAQSLAADGVYRGQFETGISNGGLVTVVGRDGWEEKLFGRAYHGPEVVSADRPKYGGLNLRDFSDGASPRFGSCHVRLRPEVNERCTFTVGDSHLEPSDVGTLEALECVLAGLVEQPAGVALLTGRPPRPAGPGRCLDDYVEAQVHGRIELGRDAEAIVLDPSFRDTPEADTLLRLAAETNLAVEWHCGFELAAEEFDDEFRGPHVPPLARHVAAGFAGRPGVIDAATVGRAAASARRRPADWESFGSPAELLQFVKHLWHTLVAFGHPSPI